jgi:hypothetical protein
LQNVQNGNAELNQIGMMMEENIYEREMNDARWSVRFHFEAGKREKEREKKKKKKKKKKP